MKNIKAIIFDAYGTLFDVNSAAEKCKDKIGDKWEAFANYWRTTQLEYTWLRSLMKRHKDFWQVTEDSLDKSMKVYDIPINKYQIQKNEVTFLSANSWDVSGGGNYGFNSVWVNRNNSTFDNLDYVPKHQIKDLSKLLDIL